MSCDWQWLYFFFLYLNTACVWNVVILECGNVGANCVKNFGGSKYQAQEPSVSLLIYIYIYLFNCNWVDTRWQQYSSHSTTFPLSANRSCSSSALFRRVRSSICTWATLSCSSRTRGLFDLHISQFHFPLLMKSGLRGHSWTRKLGERLMYMHDSIDRNCNCFQSIQTYLLTYCSRAMTKVAFSVTCVNAQSRLLSFFHASSCECVCQQV
jgi:hypothetical protein